MALVSFHAAQILGIGWLLIPFGYALIQLSRAPTNRKVFYPMLALGFLFYAPQLGFFWNIFNAAAIALWLVLAFWIALFGLILRLVRVRFGNGWMLMLAPFIWTGLEYFRSELYYLRFGWLTFGMANHATLIQVAGTGVFLLGFGFMTCAALAQIARSRSGLNTLLLVGTVTLVGTILTYGKCAGTLTLVACLICVVITQLPKRPMIRLVIAIGCILISLGLALPELGKSRIHPEPKNFIRVVGIQLEGPTDAEIVAHLNKARNRYSHADLFMLSEYTFQSPPPQTIRDWCASNQVYLVVGGKEPLGETNFYNTAYVIGTNGAIVHQQVKSVPIQFFKDGLPAPERKVWDSPWGKFGVLTCYDLSYTRVVDEFVRQGAIALLNPTMDVAEWGEQQHELHSRVAPMRAAEYGIPIFRVASSGVSQLVSAKGVTLASAPYPIQGVIFGGKLALNAKPRLPLDRWLAPVCVVIAALALVGSLIPNRKNNHG